MSKIMFWESTGDSKACSIAADASSEWVLDCHPSVQVLDYD
jgi:hypothetical protein